MFSYNDQRIQTMLFIIICILFLSHRRKWLPQPLRKLSQGKASAPPPSDRPFVKKGSEKAFKLAASVTADDEQPLAQKTNLSRFRDKTSADQAGEIENEEEVVLPPPMKPMQDPQAIINNGPTAIASSVAEHSPCKRVSKFTFSKHA